VSRTILLIDGDQYLHRGCAAVERDIRWDDENHVLSSNSIEAWEVVEGSIKKLVAHFGADAYPVVTLSEGASGGFRRALIDPTYKTHRKDDRKPLCFFDLKEKLRSSFKCVSFDSLEADDVMGILATKPGPDTKIIVSRDKDMRGIPGRLWDGRTFHVITEAGADYWHLYQTLVGDVSDGYKGCPGIGPKKAEALLKTGAEFNATVAWLRVVQAFDDAGLTADDALRNARLARILRWSDWDSAAKKPILWSPNGCDQS
jgi:DNA polymerase-1